MTASLAIISALGWALSDFLGGHAARKIGSMNLTFYMQVWIFVMILPTALAIGGSPSTNDLLLGAFGGCINAAAYALLVEGMRRRPIGAVIPPSAVVTALVPVGVGLGTGDVLPWMGILGVLFALGGAAVASSSIADDSYSSTRSWYQRFDSVALAFAVSSGVGFGLMFVLLSMTSEDAGLWPIVAMRASIPLLLALSIVKRVPLHPSREIVRRSFTTSVAAGIGIACFTVAARRGPLSIVAAIASASPAGTVAIARFFSHEPTTRVQLVGSVVAVAGVVVLTTTYAG